MSGKYYYKIINKKMVNDMPRLKMMKILENKIVNEKLDEKLDEEVNEKMNEEIKDENNEEIDEEKNDETMQETKTEKIIKTKKNSSLYELLSRPCGATMEELEKELNWKKASIRGTISNLQKEQQFCLMTINVIKPNLDNKSFYKETHYFIKDYEFNINDQIFL